MFQAGGISHLPLDGFLRVLEILQSSSRMGQQVAQLFRAQLEDLGASLEEAFDGFDKNNDGVLTRTELVQGLRSIGLTISLSDERQLMSMLDLQEMLHEESQVPGCFKSSAQLDLHTSHCVALGRMHRQLWPKPGMCMSNLRTSDALIEDAAVI